MLPDADMLVLSVIETAQPVLNIGTQIYDDLVDDVTAGDPFVLVRRIGGAWVYPNLYDRASFDVQTWGASREDAYNAAVTVRDLLYAAAHSQTTFPLGHIARFVVVQAPAELRTADQAGDIWRFQASYSLFLRPAPA